jgi:sodium transport system permease protein
MKLSSVGLIFRREVVDQLRDRRTLFMIFVLPILLYPILGLGMLQVTSAFDQKARRVAIVGEANLPNEPRLLTSPKAGTANERRFGAEFFLDPKEADRILVEILPEDGKVDWARPNVALNELSNLGFDAIMVIPPDLREKISSIGRAVIPIYYERSSEQSESTFERVTGILDRWERRIVESRLAADSKPAEYTEPVDVQGINVSVVQGGAASGGSVWARLLPFLLVMMSLTGAFYPAIDLCAGEKERGTMETLLISPASRGEIVLGKFLTIFLASVATALLNLASMGLTMSVVTRQIAAGAVAVAGPAGQAKGLADLQPPPLAAIGWMLVLLVPLSIFFSSICLALAVMARSMKEGQYYLTPLYMLALPLIFLTLLPGVELNTFFALVPITGVGLLLKDLMVGQYDQAWLYFLPVLMTTLAYGALALRWAVDQFQSEEVLFRESERFEIGSFIKHLVRDRGPLPTTGEAVLCFALLLAGTWYAMIFLYGWDPMRTTVAMHVLVILGIPLAMTLLLTSSPRRTLLVRLPRWEYALTAILLGFAIHPIMSELQPLIQLLFPTSEELLRRVDEFFAEIPNLRQLVMLAAFMPAITEEVAFRGFILSGLRSGHRVTAAVILSSILFGLLHVAISLPSQFFGTTLLGLILGALAVKSKSLLPGMLFHFTNNALGAVMPSIAADDQARPVWFEWLYRDTAHGLYHPWWVALAVLALAVLLYALKELPSAQDAGPGERADEVKGRVAEALPQ